MHDETLIIAAVVAALALVALILRPRRQPPLTIGRPVARPRLLPVRKSSLIQHIDDAFDALEIKPVRVPSINGAFDTSDVPLEVIDELTAPRQAAGYAPAAAFGAEPTMYAAAAFAAEPTVTVVDDDDDGRSPVDELAAFLARDELTALTPPRAARGSQAPIDPRAPTVRGDLRAALRSRRATSAGPWVDTRGRADRARTPS